MISKHEVSWPRLVRRYIHQQLFLYITLALMIIGYISWQKTSSDRLHNIANNYHLASNYHFVKAMEEIKQIEIHLTYNYIKKNIRKELQKDPIIPKQKYNFNIPYHLIQQEIHAAVELHRQFNNNKFDSLTTTLERKLSVFVDHGKKHFSEDIFPEQVLPIIQGLMVTLLQLEKLHSVERNNVINELNDKEEYQAWIFLILLTSILSIGLVITKRGLSAIDIITNQQAHNEEQIRIFSQVIEQSPVSVMITDTNANLIYVNSTFEQVSGYSSTEVLGKNPSMLQSGKTSESTYSDIWKALTNGKSWDCELHNRRKSGEIFCEQAHFSPVIDESGAIRHFLVIKEDITLRKEQEQHILHQAHYDTLTNLPNRFLVLDRLSQHLNEAQRKNTKVAVLFLDLDDFKKVNDTLGHDTGDKLLIEAAERLLSGVRSSDTVGRLGGDEFIILLAELIDAEDALPVMENLINQFRNAFTIDGRDLILTASIGIAVYPADGQNPSDLLSNADSAMYHAKELGRNTYSYFTEAMNNKVSRRFALEEQMHGALERGEFYILYQPKINISNSRIIGAEALLRWNNSVLGQVFPDEFIPIAEQTGMIVSIGKYVLTEALRVTKQWQQDYEPDFCIAVNLSPSQFRDPNLVSHIETAIYESAIAAESLELEITEGVLMAGHAYIVDALNTFSDLGVKLAMDDFGTGFSSLSYLRNYPFNTLKIDRSFVNDITVDTDDKELVNAIIAMAHGLSLKVVAEGVETKEQLEHLITQGCEYAQGYLFSKPIPPENLTKLLKNNVLSTSSYKTSTDKG